MNIDIYNGFFKGKKVLVTGHTGFKGSWLCIWLHELGAEVVGGHYHPEAVEWFTIIEGSAILKLEDMETHERLDIEMSLVKAITVFIPNNVAHVVVNNGDKDFILLAYTDKLYDPKDTITYEIKG